MDILQELLNKTVADFTKIKVENEIIVEKHLEKIKKEGTAEQYELVKSVFENAKQGKVSPADIVNQFKDF